MRWATRAHCHVDRAACAWLIRRFIDPDAEFVFVDDPDEVPADATPFDMRGVELSHHGGDCSFETFLRRYELDDPVLGRSRGSCTRPTSKTSATTRPRPPGSTSLLRGLSSCATTTAARAHRPLFDGLYEFRRRALLLGREPA